MAEGSGMSPVLLGQISLLAMRASNVVHQGLSPDCHRLFIPELKRPPRDARFGLLGVRLCSGQHPGAVSECDGSENGLSRAPGYSLLQSRTLGNVSPVLASIRSSPFHEDFPPQPSSFSAVAHNVHCCNGVWRTPPVASLTRIDAAD
jgi:hypothetical protein